jgi:hypothetical protein
MPYMIVLVAAVLLALSRAAANLPHGPDWHLVQVVDERTLKLRSDDGESRTITLACIGRAKDNSAAVAYISKRLRDQDLAFWHLETGRTNVNKEPQCLFLDLGLGRGGELVYDFPTLNEELLSWGYVPFADVKVAEDPFGLKARLTRAKAECERREKEREERMKALDKKWGTRR